MGGCSYALFISALLYVRMVAAGITVHCLFALVGMIPEQRPSLEEMVRFSIDHTFFLNLIFLAVAAALLWLHFRGGGPSPQTERASHARAQPELLRGTECERSRLSPQHDPRSVPVP